MKIEIDVEIPGGYEATGEYRVPARSERYMTHTGGIGASDGCIDTPRIIIRKKVVSGKAWVDSLQTYTAFVVRDLVHQKMPSGLIRCAGCSESSFNNDWSDATCKIIYTPDESK